MIASDGNLSPDGRHIVIVSEHLDYMESVRDAMGLKNRMGMGTGPNGKKYPRLQFSNVDFYHFLQSIGLMPNKSLILKKLEIPYWGFADFVRGMIDGDGNIGRWIHPTNSCEQWGLRVYSAAPIFAEWFKNAVETWFSVKGSISRNKNLWTIKFGKMAAQRIFSECYYDGCLTLTRKMKLAVSCVETVSGWSKSKTVFAAV